MILKQLLPLVLFSFISLLGVSQKAPGYMGNRLSIGANFHAVPALINPNKNGGTGFFKFNTQIGATAEYATNRHASILAHYQTYKTRKEYDNYDFVNFPNNYSSLNELSAELKVKSIGFEYRRYANSISPFGSYRGFLFNFKTIDLVQPDYLKSPTILNPPKNESPYTLLSVGYTIGKQRIYFNKIIVSTGATIMIPLEFGKIKLLKTQDGNSTYNEDIGVYKRVFLHDLFNFKIGVRYLLF